MLQITSFRTRNALMEAVASRLASALREGFTERGRACVALSGGTTPEPAYRLLAREPLDWSKATLALVDERFVPIDQEPSNEGLLRRTLAPALAAGARIAPMYSDAASPTEAAARAEILYAPLRFDIALVGMGPDGHSASWFPGASGLREALDPANPRSVIALHAPQAYGTPHRLSLTLTALKRCTSMVLLILGEDKRRRLEAALADTPENSPVAALFAGATPRPEIYWAA